MDQNFVITRGGDFVVRLTVGREKLRAKASQLLSPGIYHVFSQEAWDRLCKKHHSRSADSDMVRISVNARRREAMATGEALEL